MLVKVIIGLVVLTSLTFNVQNYLVNSHREAEQKMDDILYTKYSVMSDRNGEVMGLMQLHVAVSPIINDTIIISTEEKEYYLTVNDVKKYSQLAMGNE